MIIVEETTVKLCGSNLEKFRVFVNENHGFPNGVPYGTTISEELKEAHSCLNMIRHPDIGFELKPDGNMVPVFIEMDGKRYKVVEEE